MINKRERMLFLPNYPCLLLMYENDHKYKLRNHKFRVLIKGYSWKIKTKIALETKNDT